MTDTTLDETQTVEPVSPSLHLGAFGAARSSWLGPAWAAVCGLIASAAFVLDGPHLLLAAWVFILADWTWPALWTTLVRTDWLASIIRWPEMPPAVRSIALPYTRPGSPADRFLNWAARAGSWWRTIVMPATGASVLSGLAALVIALAVSVAIGWRPLALTLAVMAIVGLGTLRALRAAIDSDWLRSVVYGVLPWWLGHAAFAPLTAESAAMGVLFGLAYRAVMESGDHAPRLPGLIAPQIVAVVALFGGRQPIAAFVVAATIVAQAALRTFLTDDPFAHRAQFWLMIAMSACAIAVA